MKNTNKILSLVKDNGKKITAVLIIIILLLLIANKKIAQNNQVNEAKQELIQKTKIEVLVDEQSENLKIIGENLAEQKELRAKINDLQSQLDAKVDEVKQIEEKNKDLRKLMLEDANDFNN